MLRLPRLFAALLVLSLTICAFAVPSIRFDGNTLNLIPQDSELYRSYRQVTDEFRDFSGDLVVIVRADDLYTPEKFEALRNFHLDLTIAEGVAGVLSPFSSSRYDPDSGAFISTIPERLEAGDDIPAMIERASDTDPLISLTTNTDDNAALIFLETVISYEMPDAEQFALVDAIKSEVRSYAPEGVRVNFAGFPLLRADAVAALVDDQVRLTAIGVFMAILIAFVTFRAAAPALICTAPALIATTWVLGGFGLSATKVTYLSTTLPTIAMVLALADTIMIYFSWVGARREGRDVDAAIRRAIRRVGPATAMTSVTTAIAFGSFAFSGNAALRELAALGSGAVAIAFCAVMIALPILLHFLGARIDPAARRSAFAPVGGWAGRFAAWRPAATATLAVVGVALFSSGHIHGEEAYITSDKVPADSEAARGNRLAVELFGGVSPIYAIVPVPDGMSWYDEVALEAVATAEAALSEAIGEDRVFSLGRLAESGLGGERLREALADAPDNIRGRFLSDDGEAYLVTGSFPFDIAPERARYFTQELPAELAEEGVAGVEVTGYSILSATEIPAIVAALKQSLIVAIVLGVLVVALAAASPLVAVAALIPNLMPVLFIETVLWLMDIPMDVPHVIALTIAFGISIDNAIHVVNLYLVNRQEHEEARPAVAATMNEVAPALVSATAMFIAGSLGTVLSSLPAVANLGFLIIATLAVALVSNLGLLPALILTLRRFIPETVGTRTARSTGT